MTPRPAGSSHAKADQLTTASCLDATIGDVKRAWSWLDVVVGLPCVVAALSSRFVFADGDTWAHTGLWWGAFALLVAYAAAAVRMLLVEV